MRTSATGRKLIEEFEGCILGAYDDDTDHIVPLGGHSRGTLTIGYGHTSAAGAPKVFVGQSITRAQADAILGSDLGAVEADVSRLVHVPISQNQFDALVSFQFNTGALGRSGVLVHLNKKDYKGAADALLQWTHANGRVMAGLVRRRSDERKLFLAPQGAVVATGAPVGSRPTPGAPKAAKAPTGFLSFLVGLVAEFFRKPTHAA
jgi:lysozyme